MWYSYEIRVPSKLVVKKQQQSIGSHFILVHSSLARYNNMYWIHSRLYGLTLDNPIIYNIFDSALMDVSNKLDKYIFFPTNW